MKKICQDFKYERIETRILLITDINTSEDIELVKHKCCEFGDIKETYLMPGNSSCLYVIYNKLKHSIKAKNAMDVTKIGTSTINVYYTLRKYEIPVKGSLIDSGRSEGALHGFKSCCIFFKLIKRYICKK